MLFELNSMNIIFSISDANVWKESKQRVKYSDISKKSCLQESCGFTECRSEKTCCLFSQNFIMCNIPSF